MTKTTDMTVEKLATVVDLSVEKLLEQLNSAGITVNKGAQHVLNEVKNKNY